MPTRQLVFRCLIISPSDVMDARDAIERVIADWNSHIGQALGARVEPVRWERDAVPALGDRAQGLINAQLVDTCDLGVAVFWTRLGTPTGSHESGSVEEIERLCGRDARVMVYFCSAPVPQRALTDDQYERVSGVRRRYEQRGLLGTYADAEELGRTFQLHLTSTIAGLLLRDKGSTQPLPATGTATAPRPDIRVKVNRMGVFEVGGSASDFDSSSADDVIAIKVENHSPNDFFLSGVSVVLADGSGLWPRQDRMTGAPNGERIIRPGDSYTFYVSHPAIESGVRGKSPAYAVAVDKIGRDFRSREGDLERALSPAS